MARFLLVLKPLERARGAELIDGLQPLLEALQAEVDHRTPAHLSALLRGGPEQMRMQLFADVQAKAEGPVVELVLMSREPMGRGAPQSRAVFEGILLCIEQRLPRFAVLFRSDQDGAVAP